MEWITLEHQSQLLNIIECKIVAYIPALKSLFIKKCRQELFRWCLNCVEEGQTERRRGSRIGYGQSRLVQACVLVRSTIGPFPFAAREAELVCVATVQEFGRRHSFSIKEKALIIKSLMNGIS